MILNKILHRYIISNFLKTFAITFFVSLFVLVMQFMFHYADDFIGKGAGLIPIVKLFFFASLSLVPLSLPLSILLGSLMTFGNFGERLELLSMKAAGVSLFRIMSSLIIIVGTISVSSFFFADEVLPKAQVKMWTLIVSIREKSPELNIPEGSFYNEISGINMYVREKRNGEMYDVVIYDLSNGFDNMGIILADTGRLEMSNDKKYLLLTLFHGESFQNMTEGTKDEVVSSSDIIPYRRESFSKKCVIIDFDANFSEVSSAFLEGQYVSKDIEQLDHSIDSVSHRVDSLYKDQTNKYVNVMYFDNAGVNNAVALAQEAEEKYMSASLDSLYLKLTNEQKIRVLENAEARCNGFCNDIYYNKSVTDWLQQEIRVHAIEWHKKFTLAFACFIFLFIGAPLGAIIRKGGMGMPIVISTILFIVYYIIDNTGYKMAREGIWDVWCGMWLSAGVLLPLGILLTILAATDSPLMSDKINFKDIKDFLNKLKNRKNVCIS